MFSCRINHSFFVNYLNERRLLRQTCTPLNFLLFLTLPGEMHHMIPSVDLSMTLTSCIFKVLMIFLYFCKLYCFFQNTFITGFLMIRSRCCLVSNGSILIIAVHCFMPKQIVFIYKHSFIAYLFVFGESVVVNVSCQKY